MGLKIAILFCCVVLVTGRTITIEKAEWTLTEESKDFDDSTFQILQTLLDHADVTSGGQFSHSLQGCTKGKCEFCKKLAGHEACFVATLGKNSIELEATIDKKEIVKLNIKVPNPPEVCKKEIPGLKMLKDVCVQVKNVDLKNASGCVYVSFKAYSKKFSYKVACFKIPTMDGENHEAEGIEVVQDGEVLVFEPTDSNS